MKSLRTLKTKSPLPLCVFNYTSERGGVECEAVGMLSKKPKSSVQKESLEISTSTDGVTFVPRGEDITLATEKKKSENISLCDEFRITAGADGYYMIYRRKDKKSFVTVIAHSKNTLLWKVVTVLPYQGKSEVVISPDNTGYYIYTEGTFLTVTHYSRAWKELGASRMIATSRFDRFDQGKLSLCATESTESGILVLYDASVQEGDTLLVQVGGLLCEHLSPEKVVWRPELPVSQAIIQSTKETKKKTKNTITLSSLGGVTLRNKLFMYWAVSDGSVFVIHRPALFRHTHIPSSKHHILTRSQHNPILVPQGHNHWESEAVFNPATFLDDEGVVHLLYRAMGHDGISRIGYAASSDGVQFDTRTSHPVFVPGLGYGMPEKEQARVHGPLSYDPTVYISGGGWGGAEDPRTTRIGDTVYMMYVAFEGWHSVRIALTSLSVSDFKKGLWNWSKPALISAPEQVNKNWVLFPEKIGGRYAILHSIAPEIMIEYIDSLTDFSMLEKGYISSSRKFGPQPGRKYFWDNLLRGAGSPPIKTEKGWLLLYHAIDRFDPGKYKLGAMLLDLNDPTKILHRSREAILSPDMHYENDGKPGVVYNSGAVLKDDILYVYYGGGDKVVCVATTPLDALLDYVMHDSTEYFSLRNV